MFQTLESKPFQHTVYVYGIARMLSAGIGVEVRLRLVHDVLVVFVQVSNKFRIVRVGFEPKRLITLTADGKHFHKV